MIRLLADENFDNRILRGIWRAEASVDVVRVQETDLYQADDPTVLAWVVYRTTRICKGALYPIVYHINLCLPAALLPHPARR